MRDKRYLIPTLKDQRKFKIQGSIYYYLQTEFAYNSNHIEGSKLSKEQTRTLFETRTIGGDYVPADDVIETANHFRCFDYVIDTYKDDLTEDYIKKLHEILKTNTFSSLSEEAVVGDYKKYDNIVGELDTTSVEKVPEQIRDLLNNYRMLDNVSIDDIVEFHAKFEMIHPFYDGNGRVGRLIMFKECLKNGIVPVIINDRDRRFYSKGLYEWQTEGKKDRLTSTCLLMQDDMQSVFDHFDIIHEGDIFVPEPDSSSFDVLDPTDDAEDIDP